jgi:hypothetical protein
VRAVPAARPFPRPQHAADLAHGKAVNGHVFQHMVTDHQVEMALLEGQVGDVHGAHMGRVWIPISEKVSAHIRVASTGVPVSGASSTESGVPWKVGAGNGKFERHLWPSRMVGLDPAPA